MEFFTTEFFSALLAIIVIDLVLAGDNAIVIGLAARNLPKENQKKGSRAPLDYIVKLVEFRMAETIEKNKLK